MPYLELDGQAGGAGGGGGVGGGAGHDFPGEEGGHCPGACGWTEVGQACWIQPLSV